MATPGFQERTFTLNTGQVVGNAAAQQVVAANSGRRNLTLSNTGTTGAAIGGTNAVLQTTGFVLPGGATIELANHQGPVFFFGAASATITFMEEAL